MPQSEWQDNSVYWKHKIGKDMTLEAIKNIFYAAAIMCKVAGFSNFSPNNSYK
jgi:hypothetical protein